MTPGSRIYLGTTSLVEVDGLADAAGTTQNDATVTMEALVDEATGTTVTGVTLPLSMPYVAASTGKYQGQIPHSVAITAGRAYKATILAISSGGTRRQWVEWVYADDGSG